MNQMKNFLKQLINNPSYSGDERKIADFIAKEFKKNTKDHKIVIQKYSKYGRNVLVLANNSKLLIDVHLDTVSPGDITKWSSDPFELQDNSKIYKGLGIVDVKANIAICLELLKTVDCADVSFAFCGGEEAQSLGLQYALKSGLLETVKKVIVAEPTNLRFFAKHKGCLGAILTFKKETKSHSSLSKKNAIQSALNFLEIFRKDFEFLKSVDRDHSTTYLITELTSGNGWNSSPNFCTVSIEFRTLPAQTDASVVEFLNSTLKKSGAIASLEHMHFPDLNNKNAFVDTEDDLLPFWSHGGLYHQKGINTVVFGPGDIKHAHTYDEQVQKSQLTKAKNVLVKIIKKL